MAKEKSATLEIPQKQQDQFTYTEAVKFMVEQKKAEFQALLGKITQYKTQLSSLESRLITVESDHKAKLLQERQQFERERQSKLNDLNNRLDILQKSEQEYALRKTALETREAQAERGNEERNKLLMERLHYEQLNNEAKMKMDEANNLHNQASDRINEAAQRENNINVKLSEIKNSESILDKKREDLTLLENENKKNTDNLEALRKEIAPKIEELKKFIEEKENKLKELAQKEQELKDRIEEDNKLLSVIDEKERRLQKKEIDLSTKEQELLRKELVIKNL